MKGNLILSALACVGLIAPLAKGYQFDNVTAPPLLITPPPKSINSGS